MRIKILVIFYTCLVFFPFSWAGAVPLLIESESGGNVTLEVEIASNPENRRQGLMHRDSLPSRSGMLFLFPEVSTPVFWMKDTPLSLDLIYIDSLGKIVGIHEKAAPNTETKISTPSPIKAVLEISGGEAQKLGILVGDKVIFKDLINTLEVR